VAHAHFPRGGGGPSGDVARCLLPSGLWPLILNFLDWAEKFLQFTGTKCADCEKGLAPLDTHPAYNTSQSSQCHFYKDIQSLKHRLGAEGVVQLSGCLSSNTWRSGSVYTKCAMHGCGAKSWQLWVTGHIGQSEIQGQRSSSDAWLSLKLATVSYVRPCALSSRSCLCVRVCMCVCNFDQNAFRANLSSPHTHKLMLGTHNTYTHTHTYNTHTHTHRQILTSPLDSAEIEKERERETDRQTDRDRHRQRQTNHLHWTQHTHTYTHTPLHWTQHTHTHTHTPPLDPASHQLFSAPSQHPAKIAQKI
jgi:hypothetical protein